MSSAGSMTIGLRHSSHALAAPRSSLAPAGPAPRRAVHCASYSGGRQGGQSSGSVLEAFYYGRAFAEVLSERVSAATTELLSELGKQDAERRQASREFLEAVEARARSDMVDGRPAGPSSASQPVQAPAWSSSGRARSAAEAVELVRVPPRDLQEVVDDLRAEVATAKAVLQQLKAAGRPAR